MCEYSTKLIEQFIAKIKGSYPNLIIDFDYNLETDEYDVWHLDSKLQFEDEAFVKYVGQLMQEILFDNGIFNFSFGYDHLKVKSSIIEYNFDAGYDVEVGLTFNSNSEKLDFYFSNSNPIKLDDIKTNINFFGKNRANYFNVLNNGENLSNGLEYRIEYINKDRERLVA